MMRGVGIDKLLLQDVPQVYFSWQEPYRQMLGSLSHQRSCVIPQKHVVSARIPDLLNPDEPQC